MGKSRKFRQGEAWGWGHDNVFLLFCFSHQCILQRAVRTSLEKQLDPRGTIASRWGSVPVFLRKPITTCNFPRGGGVRLPLSASTRGNKFVFRVRNDVVSTQ